MYRPKINFHEQYLKFSTEISNVDCGLKCLVNNPSGKPFCCDICEAVPVVYDQEWNYLRKNTDLWHVWSDTECSSTPEEIKEIENGVPNYQILLACKGPTFCQREYRAISCRQFPFFPYISKDYRFIGIAYEWHFESKCWVINNLNLVSDHYRAEFILFYDELFSIWPQEMESYANLSEQLRLAFLLTKRRIPVLHRNGGYYLMSPKSEKLYRINPLKFQKHGAYKLTPR